MYARLGFALAVALVTALAARRAHASPEVHQTGDDAHVLVDARGVATVEHELRWHIVRGPVRSIDLVNVDPSAVIEPTVSIAVADGRTLAAQATRRDERTVRIVLDEPRALMRGNFAFAVRWRSDLVASGAIWREGEALRLALSAPVASDGFDGARSVIEVPTAPSEPRPIAVETGAIDDSAVATLRRGLERDVLELVRPHVARGESATWTLRVDPRALPGIADAPLSRPSEMDSSAEPSPGHEVLLCLALAALGLAFGLLVAHKGQAFAEACAARGCRARSFLPLPDRARAPIAGAALAGAVGLEIVGEMTAGAGCLALAILAAATCAPRVSPAPRGPGRWLALRPEEAFASPGVGGHWLDIGSRAGCVAAAAAVSVIVAVAVLAQQFDTEGACITGLDAAALLPLFVTGRASQFPPDRARSAAPWLALAFRSLRAVAGIRVAPWARVAPDGGSADELRLLVVPSIAMPGVVGLEVGLAWNATPVGWAAMPEVLARVLEGSAAAARLAREIPGVGTMPGRRSDERVMRLLPRTPTRSSTVALLSGLADALTDRRSVSGSCPPLAERRSTDARGRAA